MTVLWFAPKPERNGCAITRTSRKRSRTASTDPSSDALSRTTISTSSPLSDSRHPSRRSRLPALTIETETSAGEATRNQGLTCGVDGIGRLLRGEPRKQILHPVLERDLRTEAEQLFRELRVCVAMADVARAVLVDDLRLDLLAETLCDHARDVQHRGRAAGADVDRAAVRAGRCQRESAAA